MAKGHLRVTGTTANRFPTETPSLLPSFIRGASRSPFKRPRPDAPLPSGRVTRPAVRADPRRLAAYERICGFATGRDALPVTYPHVLGFPLAMRLMSARDFPLPLLGLVHTSIEIVQHRAIGPGEELELTVYAEGLAPHRKGTEATVVTGARVGGAAVWESRSTYLARHGTSAKDAATGTGAGTGFEPLPARAEWRLSGDLGRRYGAASGDRNPIHLHPLSARLFGFPRAVAHGMWTVARCLAAHSTDGPVRVRADFRAPVLLPATVTYGASGAAFDLRSGDDGGRLHVRGEARPLDLPLDPPLDPRP
ncbi:MaoC family dehydratase [Streptomyces sp. NPDC058001]|uniref:MaoC family dehydratase n=1 Tax=Streptomyces sp. NPDC058001 TaxID=3346300 RepID=UPI0036EE460E